MDSVLAVITPAERSNLCTLKVAKLELGIEGSRFDPLLQRWITVASSQIATFCNRVFGNESASPRLGAFRFGSRCSRHFRQPSEN